MSKARVRLALAVVVAIGPVAAAACDDQGTAEGVQKVEHLADAYVAVLASLLPEVAPTPDDSDASTPTSEPVDESRPVVFLWQFGDEVMSLDEQVVVIESFDGDYDVRFVDAFDAAVDGGAESVPPRDGGVVIGLGRVTVDHPHTLRVEVYRGEHDTAAFVYTLVVRDDEWVVTGREPVDPEALDAVV